MPRLLQRGAVFGLALAGMTWAFGPVGGPNFSEPETSPSPAPVGPVVVPKAADSTSLAAPTSGVRTVVIGLDTLGQSSAHRSAWTAVGLTALLPGTGHRYLGYPKKATPWMATDLALWGSVLASWKLGTLYRADAAEIANRYANAQLGSSPEDALLEAIGAWRSRHPSAGRRDSYDEALVQSGQSPTSRFPDDPAHDWDWGSPENPESNVRLRQFDASMRSLRMTKVAVAFASGGLVLSRVIAIADILRINRGTASRAGLHSIFVPAPDGGALLVAVQF